MKKGDKVEIHNPYPETETYKGRVTIIVDLQKLFNGEIAFKLKSIKPLFLKEEIRKI